MRTHVQVYKTKENIQSGVERNERQEDEDTLHFVGVWSHSDQGQRE